MKRKREAELVLKKKEEEAEEIKKERWYTQTDSDELTNTVAMMSESQVFGLERLSQGRRSFGSFKAKKEIPEYQQQLAPVNPPIQQDTKPTTPDQFLDSLKGFLKTENFYQRKKPKGTMGNVDKERKEGKEGGGEVKKFKSSKKKKNKNKGNNREHHDDEE